MDLKKISKQQLLLLFGLLFAVAYFIFFPKIYSSIDEHEYAKNAVALVNGNLIADNLEYACGSKLFSTGYVSPQYIGKSIFLIPFLPLGIFGLMVFGLINHLINFFLVFKIMKKLNFNELFAVFYLFYPALTWVSRTLYIELLVATFLLAAFYFYLDAGKKLFISGALFGMATLVRYDAALAFISFFGVALIRNRKNALMLLLGFLPLAAGILIMNQFLYGGLFEIGYGNALNLLTISKKSDTNFMEIITNFVIYFIILLVAYPLMAVAPLAKRKRTGFLEIMVAVVIYMLFYSKFSRLTHYEFSIPFYLTIRLRYLIPIIALLIITLPALYELIMEKIRLKKAHYKLIFVLATFLLVTGTIVVSMVHNNFISERNAVLMDIYNNTTNGSVIIGIGDDCMYFVKDLFPDRKYLSMDTFDEKKYVGHKIYVMQLIYSNYLTRDPSNKRQAAVDAEKQPLNVFIENNKSRLKLKYETNKPHLLKIYELI